MPQTLFATEVLSWCFLVPHEIVNVWKVHLAQIIYRKALHGHGVRTVLPHATSEEVEALCNYVHSQLEQGLYSE